MALRRRSEARVAAELEMPGPSHLQGRVTVAPVACTDKQLSLVTQVSSGMPVQLSRRRALAAAPRQR